MCALDRALIYGATGYTGRLIAEAMIDAGLRPVLSGRDSERVGAVATELGIGHRIARIDDAASLDTALRDITVALNVAGPFTRTAEPMVDACLRSRVHYLDVAGEVEAFEMLSRRHGEARARGIMVMPGVGYD